MNICKRAVAGELFPGDEGDNYQENPGEALRRGLPRAEPDEAGRDLDRLGHRRSGLYPNATALSMLEQDITTPWKGPTLPTCAARSATAPSRTIVSQDHARRVVRRPPARPDEVAHAARSSSPAGRLVASGSSVRYEICGQRALTLKVQRVSGRGTFTVDVSKP